MVTNVQIAILAVFTLIVAGTFVLRKKKNVKSFGPLILYKTKRGVHLINKIAQLSPRFWKAFYTFGIIVGLFFMVNLFYTLLRNAFSLVTAPAEAIPTVHLLIPGITVPLWGSIFGIIVLLIVHEFSHGIVARAEGITVKDVGTASLGFLPIGAFVEPDEKQAKKAKTSTQLRIFAAGSFMNILVAIILIAFTTLLILPFFTNPIEGIYLKEIATNSPAETAGLRAGMIITSFGGFELTDVFSFADALQKLDLKPGESVDITTSEGEFTATVGAQDGSSYIGISTCGAIPTNSMFKLSMLMPFAMTWIDSSCYPVTHGSPALFWGAYSILIWVVIINYGVGIFNLLPLKPLDGGLMVESIAKKFAPKLAKTIVYTLSGISLIILLLNLFGPSVLQSFV